MSILSIDLFLIPFSCKEKNENMAKYIKSGQTAWKKGLAGHSMTLHLSLVERKLSTTYVYIQTSLLKENSYLQNEHIGSQNWRSMVKKVKVSWGQLH